MQTEPHSPKSRRDREDETSTTKQRRNGWVQGHVEVTAHQRAGQRHTQEMRKGRKGNEQLRRQKYKTKIT